MVLECQGVNYDLMSSVEKVAVEEGFLQFLNSLRYPIQIYVQSRTVDLTKSLDGYRKKLKEWSNGKALKTLLQILVEKCLFQEK